MYLSIIILPLLGSIVSGLIGRKVGVTGAQHKVHKMKHVGVFLLRKVCVLGTEIQFIVYNDLEFA